MNLRPLDPQSNALAKLRYAPINESFNIFSCSKQTFFVIAATNVGKRSLFAKKAICCRISQAGNTADKKILDKLGSTNYISSNEVMKAQTDNNLSASLEDYLEAIFNIAGSSGVARSKDIAETLGVSCSSVTGAMHLLSKKHLANYKPYDYVTLTEQGRKGPNKW